MLDLWAQKVGQYADIYFIHYSGEKKKHNTEERKYSIDDQIRRKPVCWLPTWHKVFFRLAYYKKIKIRYVGGRWEINVYSCGRKVLCDLCTYGYIKMHLKKDFYLNPDSLTHSPPISGLLYVANALCSPEAGRTATWDITLYIICMKFGLVKEHFLAGIYSERHWLGHMMPTLYFTLVQKKKSHSESHSKMTSIKRKISHELEWKAEYSFPPEVWFFFWGGVL